IATQVEVVEKLSMPEASRVWLWILGPQLALFLTLLVIWRYVAELPPEIVQGIPSWSLFLKFLVVGPYAVGLALRASHPGFNYRPMGTDDGVKRDIRERIFESCSHGLMGRWPVNGDENCLLQGRGNAVLSPAVELEFGVSR